MRRTTGLAAVVAALGALGTFGGFALGLGCSHEARPVVQPGEPPPLPPASGTPIGYLVDAGELELSDDQLARLKEIDVDLAGRLTALDGILRNASAAAAAPPSETDSRPRGLGFRAGGSAAGVGGGAQGFPGGGGAQGFPGGGGAQGFPSAGGDGAQPARSGVDPETARRLNANVPNQVAEARAYDVRKAIADALALLDAGQQAIARRVLTEHGVDPDTGRSTVGEPAGSGTDSGSNER